MTREPILVALFAKLAALPGLATSSRVLQHFSQVAASDQPALFVSPVAHSAIRTRGLPPKWTLDVDVYLYLNRASSDVPDTVLNGILDALEVALAPAPAAEVQTLGGLCEHCWIEGSVQIEVGALGTQVIALVPLKILVAT